MWKPPNGKNDKPTKWSMPWMRYEI
jgi:hypothetical protein